VPEGVEFLIVTNWDSIEAIEQFFGREPEFLGENPKLLSRECKT